MGSFDDFEIAYRGHEPAGPVGRVSPLRAVCPSPSPGAHGVTRPTLRFMGSRPYERGGRLARGPNSAVPIRINVDPS